MKITKEKRDISEYLNEGQLGAGDVHRHLAASEAALCLLYSTIKDCLKNCPPSYECKQPEMSEYESDFPLLREKHKPKVFEEHCPKDFRIYRNIFFFLCLPAVLCVFINTFYMNDQVRKRPKFVEFSYLRIRRKPYVWDETRTLFHNPRYNALPTGYEIEVPEDEEYDPCEPEKR